MSRIPIHSHENINQGGALRRAYSQTGGGSSGGDGSDSGGTTGGPTPVAFDDLTDATITTPAEGDTARFDGSVWVNYSGHYEPVIADFGSGPEIVFDSGDIVMEWFD